MQQQQLYYIQRRGKSREEADWRGGCKRDWEKSRERAIQVEERERESLPAKDERVFQANSIDTSEKAPCSTILLTFSVSPERFIFARLPKRLFSDSRSR